MGIARSALLTHQASLQVISQNIANAETPGYSRQEAVLSATTPVRMSYGMIGTGVQINSVARTRDALLDENFRTASGQAGEASTRRDALGAVQEMFGEPSDAGMSNALDQFWNSWSDLASSPSSQAARAVVQQRGQQVGELFNSYDTGLSQQRNFTMDRLTSTVNSINDVAQQLADLNGRITSNEVGAGQASDLRDQRDMMMDKLAQMAGTRGVIQADGTVSVVIGNSTLVDGGTARPLKLQLDLPNPAPAVPPADVPVKVLLGNSIDRLTPLGGQLKAMVDTINTGIPSVRSRLDALASSLATSVNTAHKQGFVFNGTTLPGTAAGDFFDPGSVATPVSAATLKLSTAVAGDINQIAVSKDPNAPTDNQVGLAMSALRSDITTVSYNSGGTTETGSFLGFFRSTVTRLGLQVQTATDDATVGTTLSEQADSRRQSVSGVNSDEELIQMLRVQQAYTAATKLIKTADEMLQTVLSLI
jgi:flagellar hook-associated protein 1 FlgK